MCHPGVTLLLVLQPCSVTYCSLSNSCIHRISGEKKQRHMRTCVYLQVFAGGIGSMYTKIRHSLENNKIQGCKCCLPRRLLEQQLRTQQSNMKAKSPTWWEASRSERGFSGPWFFRNVSVVVSWIEYGGHAAIFLTNWYPALAPTPVFQVCEGVKASFLCDWSQQ